MLRFTATADYDFSIIKSNDILEIIKHNYTGYYNITKIAHIINMLNITHTRPKNINVWFSKEETKDLIDFVQNELYEMPYYGMEQNGTSAKFTGIYVHRLLFKSFLKWIANDSTINEWFESIQ